MTQCLSSQCTASNPPQGKGWIKYATLSVRKQAAGGGVADEVTADHDPRGQSRILLLVHGYNVNQCQAEQSYTAFLNSISKDVSTSNFPAICFFYWPGDINLLAGAAYPFEMNHVTDSAKHLASYLGANAGAGGAPMEIHIVAHSLGNRLVDLFMEELMRFGSGTRIASYTSMAAAVPVRFVQNGGRFFDVAQQLPGGTAQPHILFSTEDHVLRNFFPTGETIIFEGWFPEAIGRYGKPYSGNQSEQMPGYDHCNYWAGPESAVSFVRYAHLESTQSSRIIATTTIETYILPPANSIETATIAERPLAARQSFS